MKQEPQAPAEEIGGTKRRRVVGGVLIAGVASLLAAPAALAAVWSINEVDSEWELTDCLTKVEGADAADFDDDVNNSFYIDFDAANTAADPGTNAAVLQEVLTVKAPAGFRTYSTDTFQLVADSCGHDFTVSLTANNPNSLGQDAIDDTANWADKGLRIYLSEVANPNDDFGSADWEQVPLTVTTAGAVTPSGTATLSDDSNLVVGFELAGGATPAPDAGILRFQVNFTPIP